MKHYIFSKLEKAYIYLKPSFEFSLWNISMVLGPVQIIAGKNMVQTYVYIFSLRTK